MKFDWRKFLGGFFLTLVMATICFAFAVAFAFLLVKAGPWIASIVIVVAVSIFAGLMTGIEKGK